MYVLTGEAVTILPEERFKPAYWNEQVCKLCGIEEAKLPPFVGIGDVCGILHKQLAAELSCCETGICFSNNCRVIAGGPDFIVALIGTGKTNDEEVCISMDHDAGDYRSCGGDYIEILNRLDEMCGTDRDWKNWVSTKVTFHIHSMNPVGVQNMRRIIQRNGWTEKQ